THKHFIIYAQKPRAGLNLVSVQRKPRLETISEPELAARVSVIHHPVILRHGARLNKTLFKTQPVICHHAPKHGVLVHNLLPDAVFVVFKLRGLSAVKIIPCIHVTQRREHEVVPYLDVQGSARLVLHGFKTVRIAKLPFHHKRKGFRKLNIRRNAEPLQVLINNIPVCRLPGHPRSEGHKKSNKTSSFYHHTYQLQANEPTLARERNSTAA